jgi:hypothetical protein
MLRRIVALFLISGAYAFAQTDNNSLTVTVSRASNPQADQAQYSVYVNTGLDKTLDDVLAAVQPVGLTIANLLTVSTLSVLSSNGPGLQWTFTLVAPLSGTGATIASLTNLQKTIAKTKSGIALSFTLQGTQVSSQALQSQTCSLAGLLMDANGKAQSLAGASQRFVSGLVALATSVNQGQPTCSMTAKYSLVGF